MDHTRDNPLKRFTAFWIAILLVFCFGVALILLRPLTHREGKTASEVIGAARLEVKEEIDRAQGQVIDASAHQKAIETSLASFADQPVTKGARPVPPPAAPASPKGEEPAADQPEGDSPSSPTE